MLSLLAFVDNKKIIPSEYAITLITITKTNSEAQIKNFSLNFLAITVMTRPTQFTIYDRDILFNFYLFYTYVYVCACVIFNRLFVCCCTKIFFKKCHYLAGILHRINIKKNIQRDPLTGTQPIHLYNLASSILHLLLFASSLSHCKYSIVIDVGFCLLFAVVRPQ